MAAWDTYETFDEFHQALLAGKHDAKKLLAHVEGTEFYILDEQEEELISGDESDIIPVFFKLLGITNVEYE